MSGLQNVPSKCKSLPIRRLDIALLCCQYRVRLLFLLLLLVRAVVPVVGTATVAVIPVVVVSDTCSTVCVHNCECNATQSLRLINMQQVTWESRFRATPATQQLLAVESFPKIDTRRCMCTGTIKNCGNRPFSAQFAHPTFGEMLELDAARSQERQTPRTALRDLLFSQFAL